MDNGRILLVEDERITALDVERSLKGVGYEVIAKCTSGEEAIRVATDARPDLVLMDIVLDGEIDGISAAAHIKDSLGIPSVFLTAHTDERTLERAQLTEPEGYLVKPFQESELHAAIQMALYKYRMPRTTVGMQNGHALDKERSRSKEDIVRFLRSLEFFSSLVEEEIQLFANSCQWRQVSAGDEFIRAGDPSPGAFIVVHGRVALVSPTSGARQLVVEVLPPGDLLGLISALENEETPVAARAQTHSELLWIPKSSFLLMLDSHPVLARRFAEYIVMRLRRSHHFSKMLAHSQVLVRVATALLKLLPPSEVAETSEQGSSIEITRQDLADITGAAVETVVRSMKELESMGIVRPGERRRVTVLDRKKLEQIAKEQ